MAETANKAPGTHPDAVIINDDGSVTTRYQRGFVWVSDDKTGNRFDVPARMLPRQGLTVVPNYPVNYDPTGRPVKYRLDLAGDRDEPELAEASAVAGVAPEQGTVTTGAGEPATGDEAALAVPGGAEAAAAAAGGGDGSTEIEPTAGGDAEAGKSTTTSTKSTTKAGSTAGGKAGAQ
jgi:hypothetical protein